jgi:hypothetical protein
MVKNVDSQEIPVPVDFTTTKINPNEG